MSSSRAGDGHDDHLLGERTIGPERTRRPALIAYDGFAPSAEAIRTAGEVLAGRPVLVLHVWEPLQRLASRHRVLDLLGGDTLAATDRLAAEMAEHIADYGARGARALGFDAESLAVGARAPVAETLLEVANDIDAAVIVLGTHGQDGIRPVHLGRVAQHIVTRGTRPALVVASPAAAEARQAINDVTVIARASHKPDPSDV